MIIFDWFNNEILPCFGEKNEAQKIQPLDKIVIDKSNIDIKNENENEKNENENESSWDII